MRRAVLLLCCLAASAVALSAQTFTTLAGFDGANGSNPMASLIQATDGNLYGTTYSGGTNGLGAVFKVTPRGTLSILYNFCSQQNCMDGTSPYAGLVQAKDGNFYGTTSAGGDSNAGTVFKITPAGGLTTLYSFCTVAFCADGQFPDGTLLQATDGNFYGTTSAGGSAYFGGTVFKITPAGDLTTLYSFQGTDGEAPLAGLAQGTDGNFYGTTSQGGSFSDGTVFKTTPGGALTTLYNFSGDTDGYAPQGVLVQAGDGNFYGTTAYGGDNNGGTVFKVTPEGGLSTFYAFCTQFDCSDGAFPAAGLSLASDGNFYGTTLYGESNSYGTVFKLSPAGILTTLHSFNYSDGAYPHAGVVQATDSDFFGTTSYGGIDNCSYGCGTVFRLDAGLARFLLSVNENGSGMVSSFDGRIYCGTICSYSYAPETTVRLSAIPAPGYTLSGWTGCDNVNGSYCSVTMAAAKNVTTNFAAANITLTSLIFKPSYVKGGRLSTGTLTLSGPAPSGGVAIALSSDHPEVAHPPSFVFVPGNQSSAEFAVKTLPVKSNTTVSIIATAGNSQVSGTLTVGTTSLPPSLK